MQSSKKTLLSLVRLGIGHRADALSEPVNWKEVQALADKQGLAAVLVDGIERIPNAQRPPKDFMLMWIGEVLQGYEYRYELYKSAIAELASFYREHGLKMMVLKGYSCSLNWPKPEHRPCGDIDIWLFGEQKKADEYVTAEKGINVDNSHHHHTVFEWKGFLVENHYDFLNIHAEHSSAKMEVILKELGHDDSYHSEIKRERIYHPSPNLHALFLLRHMVGHFAAAEISLRQVLDWAFFVEKHNNEVDWDWLLGVLEEYHMRDFFNLINAICVDDFGFPADIFHEIRYLPQLKDRVLDDILEPAYVSTEPSNLIPRLIYKFRRWQGNAWKQKMCYKESRWENFWTGLWAHMLKPTSI